ncbi:MAG: hypothetical protein ACT4QF_24050 [Sporichthyaceae bacterium]
MTGTAVIEMHQPWSDEEIAYLPAPERNGGFLARYRADLILAGSTVATAVGAGFTARLLCGV